MIQLTFETTIPAVGVRYRPYSVMAGLHAMVFIHMPPFERDHLSSASPTSSIPIKARTRFLDACAIAGVKVIACGQEHVYRKVRHRGMDIVWAPATAMVDVRHPLARRGAFPRPGYLEWTLGPYRAEHVLVEPERMFVIDMTGWTVSNGGTTTTLPRGPEMRAARAAISCEQPSA